MSTFKTERLENGNIKVTIPIVIKKTAIGKRIEVADEGGEGNELREAMLLAIARGRRWQKLIDERAVDGVREIAERTGRNESYVARIIRLACLSPEIVHLILSGEYPPMLSLEALKGSISYDWDEQREQFLTKQK